MEQVEYAVAARHARALRRVSSKGLRAIAESAPTLMGLITLGEKRTGEPCAGNPHARFDRAGAGNGVTAKPKRARSWKRLRQPRLSLRTTAPVLDPTPGETIAAPGASPSSVTSFAVVAEPFSTSTGGRTFCGDATGVVCTMTAGEHDATGGECPQSCPPLRCRRHLTA